MNRRAAGVAFLAIAAVLYTGRLLAAAIWGSSVQNWDKALFQSLLSYIGEMPLILALVAAGAGVVYLVWAEARGA